MMYFPRDMQQAIIILSCVIVGIIIFLWGYAVRKNQETETYKLSQYKKEKLELRQENAELAKENKKLEDNYIKYRKFYHRIRNVEVEGE